jgi:hypothetical protein
MALTRCFPAQRGTSVPRWAARGLWMALCTASSGCAIGSFGTLAANVDRRDTVSVLSVYAVGLHLRTRADDRGAHLGYSRRVYTFAADDTLQPGWYLLRVPSPAGNALAQDMTTFGIELSVVAPEAGLSLGYIHTRLMARVPHDACVVIDYAGAGLGITRLQTFAEDAACAKP